MPVREKILRALEDVPGASLCALSGIFISALPHALMWERTGNAVWIADHDELDVYLLIASHAYHHHPFYLTDPACSGRATYLPWLLLVPGVLLAKMCGLSPAYIGLMWRLLAGAGAGIAWYAVFRIFFSRRYIATVLTLLALFDVGVFEGRPLIEGILELKRLCAASPSELFPYPLVPEIESVWRIMDPALSRPFLLAYISVMVSTLRSNSRLRTLGAGTAFGLCFSYFYYWTAIALSLILAAILDRPRWKTYLRVGSIGSAVGAPVLISSILLKRAGNADWLPRVNLFLFVGHWKNLLFPKFAFAVAVAMLFWVWRKQRGCVYLWCLCVSGLLLINEQVLTGLEIDNFHWLYVWAPTLWLLLVLFAFDVGVDSIRWGRIAEAAVTAAAAFVVVGGTWMRVLQVDRAAESLDLTRAWAEFSPEFTRARDKIRQNAVVSGDPVLVNLLCVSNGNIPLEGYGLRFSSCIDNEEWRQRIALNDYVDGLERKTFARVQAEKLARERWGEWGHSSSARGQEFTRRMRDFERIMANPSSALDRFRVAYSIARSGVDTKPQGGGWRKIVHGPTWDLWERPLPGEGRFGELTDVRAPVHGGDGRAPNGSY